MTESDTGQKEYDIDNITGQADIETEKDIDIRWGD